MTRMRQTAHWLNYLLPVGLMCGTWAAEMCGQEMRPLGYSPVIRPAGLSGTERAVIYSPKVIDRKVSFRCPEMRMLWWASPEKMEAELYQDRTAKLQSVIKWLREFIALSDKAEVQTLVERGEESIYVTITPAIKATRLRLWRNLDGNSLKPSRIDILIGESFQLPQLKSAVDELAALDIKGEARLADLSVTKGLVEMLPLKEQLVKLPWSVRGFSLRRDCQLVEITLEAERPRVEITLEAEGPHKLLLMRLFLGPNGLQGSIEGGKLESPSVLFGPASTSYRYTP